MLYRYHPLHDGEPPKLPETPDGEKPQLPKTSPDYKIWKSNDWTNYNNVDKNSNDKVPYPWYMKWRYFRYSEYIDTIRNDDSHWLWESFVQQYLIKSEYGRRYINVTKDSGGGDDNTYTDDDTIIMMFPYKIYMYRIWQYIEDPTTEEMELKNMFKPLTKRERKWQQYNFYTWEDADDGEHVYEIKKRKQKGVDETNTRTTLVATTTATNGLNQNLQDLKIPQLGLLGLSHDSSVSLNDLLKFPKFSEAVPQAPTPPVFEEWKFICTNIQPSRKCLIMFV